MVISRSPNHSKSLVRISKSGQVTLPSHIRTKLGVEIGDQVEFFEQKDGTIGVKPARILSVKEIAGKFGRPVNPNDLQNALDEARHGSMIRQRYADGTLDDDSR